MSLAYALTLDKKSTKLKNRQFVVIVGVGSKLCKVVNMGYTVTSLFLLYLCSLPYDAMMWG